jgi:hypothetical protein
MPVLDWTVITVSKPAMHIAWTHSLRDGAHLMVNQHGGLWYSWELLTRDPVTDQRGRASTLEDAQREAEMAAAGQGLLDIATDYARPDMDRAQVASLLDVAMRERE